MGRAVQEGWRAALNRQRELESYLEGKTRSNEEALSGLVDLDVLFGLAVCKLEIAILIMDHMNEITASGEPGEWRGRVRREA